MSRWLMDKGKMRSKMKNFEKYKTAEERAKALRVFCNSNKTCKRCTLYDATDDVRNCAFHWLELEAEEENPEPCFYCGNEMHYRVEHRNFICRHWLECTNSKCNFKSPKYESKEEAIAAHNRVCRAVKAAKEGEVSDGE